MRSRLRRPTIVMCAAFTLGACSSKGEGGTTTPPPSITSAASTTTAAATTTSPASTSQVATTIAPSSTTTSVDRGDVPGVVTVIRAGPGGGSGEVVLDWNAVASSTRYRVLRSGAAGGTFETVADFNVTNGVTTAGVEVVNIWSAQHTYRPSGGALKAPDTSPWFQYVEVNGSDRRCFRIIAYNAAGHGPTSAAACASPPGFG